MAWRVESMMDQRLCFIAACLRADEPMSGLCLRFEISRKTGYKWLSRYRDFGALGEDVARPPAATVAEQQVAFDVWRQDFNAIRPHEAPLGQRCPAEFYTPSPRCYPEKIAVWEYPADHQIRRVGGDGYIKWRDGKLYLSEAMRKETIALTQRDDGNWAIRFRNFDLGTLTDEGNEIRRSGLVRLSHARLQAAM
jgi:putative transposase